MALRVEAGVATRKERSRFKEFRANQAFNAERNPWATKKCATVGA